ncbi:MAG: hypothetical protein ABJB02_09505 [Dokdonella sp.]
MRTSAQRIICGLGFAVFSLAAMATNGDLDPTFGVGGFRLAGIPDATVNAPTTFAIQADGKILVCGGQGRSPDSPTGEDFVIARFTANGALDTSFSFDGRVTIDFGGNDLCHAVAVQADGKIVVAGTTTPISGDLDNSDFAVARLQSDGTLDTTFGPGTGKVVVGFDLGGSGHSGDSANSMVLRPDGKIVVAGSAETASNGTDFAVLQLDTDGTRDPGFNFTGRVSVGFDFAASTSKNDIATNVAIDAQGRIVVGGAADRGPAAGADFAVIRLLANGQLDANFDADGRATLGFNLGGAGGSNDDLAYSMTLQRDGKIVLLGLADSSTTSTRNYDMAIARLLPDGSPDAGFGIGGKSLVVFDVQPSGADVALGCVEQSNGKLVFAGLAADAASVQAFAAVVRLNPDGTPDSSFGSAGKKTYDLMLTSPSVQPFFAVGLQGNRLVFAGEAGVDSLGHYDIFVARVLDDLIFANGFE